MKISTPIAVSFIISLGLITSMVVYFNRQDILQNKKSTHEIEMWTLKEKKIQAEKELNEKKYYLCINAAKDTYSSSWENECQARGLGDDCLLPMNLANRYDDLKKHDMKTCMELYK